MVEDTRDGRTALVLFGSETGNAHDVADELGRMMERLRFSTYVLHLDAVDPSVLVEYSIVILAVSTTGQGDLPSNANAFWRRLLRKKLPPTYLNDVRFAAFGLGDSSYPKYNWAVRKLQKRLIQLGAKEVYPQGEADEQHPEGSDASFMLWSSGLRQCLLEVYPLDQGLDPIPDNILLEPEWILSPQVDSDVGSGPRKHQEMDPDLPSSKRPKMRKEMYQANTESHGSTLNVVLDENRRLTPPSHWQDVRHLTLMTSDHVSYMPGDVLTIYAQNPVEDVDSIISLMEWSDLADQHIEIKHSGTTHPAKTNSLTSSTIATSEALTLRTLLTSHLDLNAIPRRSFFSIIAHFTKDAFQKDRLVEFTKPEYLDELYDYTTRPRRSILEVLQEFNTVKIPWHWAASVLPELRGRQFSIASGGSLKYAEGGSTRFELVVAIVKYKTVIKKIREGICTRYIASLPVGSTLRVTLHKGSLGITEADAKRPIVTVGPGTGIAPIRSLFWERLQWGKELADECLKHVNGAVNSHNYIGDSAMFFGNRNRHADYLYETDWQEIQEKIPLRVFTAFSRDQKPKVYVQDRVKEQSKLLFQTLYEASGIIYICGSSGKMPQAVRDTLVEIFQTEGHMETDAAEEYLRKMEKEGRYKQETW